MRHTMNAILRHARQNTVAYVALFVALAGTSYAALRVPTNSVGERQLRNHSIDPVKLNPRFFGGYVRKWATVDASGHLIASGGPVKVTMPSFLPPANYVIDWLTHPRTRCTSIVSLDEHSNNSSGPAAGSVTSGTTQNDIRGVETSVSTFGSSGTPEPESFDIALLC